MAELREAVEAMFEASTLAEQRHIYKSQIKPALWGRMLRWITHRDLALAMLGVPRSQRQQIDSCYPAGMTACISDQVEDLLAHVPMKDNYFWRVYV